MTISKRRGKFWSFRKWVRTPTGVVRVTGVPTSWGLSNTRAGAEEALRIVTNLAREGKPWRAADIRKASAPPPPGETFASFAPLFLEISEADNKHSSMVSKRSMLRLYILPALGAVELKAVTYAILEDFKLAMRKRDAKRGGKKLSHKTINNALEVVHRMLRSARKRGLVDALPDMDKLKVDPAEFDFLDFGDAARLIAASPEGEWRTMITIALKTGLRQGELLGLRWEDVDLVKGEIRVRQAMVRGEITTPKNRKPRDVPLSREASAALKAQRHLRGPLVFCQPDGSPWTPNQAWPPIVQACKRAGLRAVGWHDLRHTFASHLAMMGVRLQTIQGYLGHASITMTMRYAHLTPDSRSDEINAIDGCPAPDWARFRKTGPDSE